MSSNERKAQLRAANDAAYEREYNERTRKEREHRKKYGALIARLEELGIDIDLLAEYLTER